MADINNIPNITSLPVLQEIVPGNSFIVFDGDEPKLLDFNNFIIDPANISFSEEIQNNSNLVVELSTNIQELSTIFNESLLNTDLNTLSSSLISTIATTSGTLVTNLQTSSASLTTSLRETSSYNYTAFLPIAWAFYRTSTAAASEIGACVNLLTNTAPLCSSFAGNISSVMKIGSDTSTCYNVRFCNSLPSTNYLVFGDVEGSDNCMFTINTFNKTLSGFTYVAYNTANTTTPLSSVEYTHLSIYRIF